MKEALVRLMAVVGLVPARRYAALSRHVDKLRDEASTWKKRAEQTTKRVTQLEAELKRQTRQLSDCRASAERLQRQAGEFTAMQARLGDTTRDLALAREHLMAIEVKLDILEGAANALDARTRAATPRQTGAAV